MLGSLDSNALYDILANTPSPTVYDNDDDNHNDHPFALRHSASGDVARAPSNALISTVGAVGTVGGEFLSAVYLDSPGVRWGTTQPLRVRKKVAPRVAPIGPCEWIRSNSSFLPSATVVRLNGAARRRRKSTISLPRTPRTPLSPTSSRSPGSPRTPRTPISPTTITRSTPMRTPSNKSNSSAHRAISQAFLSLPVSPMPPIPSTKSSSSVRTRKQRSPSGQSELHLGLGRFTAYDPTALPGPSPPASPLPSPITRQFSYTTPPRNKKPLPSSPRTPMTPSRAPRKAAELLGAGYTAPSSRKTQDSRKSKKREHFRPLPVSALVEIERFFGDIPKKPSKTPPGLKVSSRSAHPSKPSSYEKVSVEDRAVGEGKSTRYKDEEGQMWLDVEEEQEFAWLMGEPMVAPPSLPPVGDTLHRIASNDEEEWGMERFTSVLSLSGKSGKSKRLDGESWLDLETPVPRKAERSKMLDLRDDTHIWANKALPAPPTTLSSSLPSNPGTLVRPPPRSSSRTPPSRNGRTPSPKSKNRPPPLTLSDTRPRGNLPVITATTPTHSRPGVHKSKPSIELLPAPEIKDPTTPFAHPRPAPAPKGAPPVPSIPQRYASMNNISLPYSIPVEEEPVSFFEPVTPIAATGPTAGFKGKAGAGGAWLKKVVKPLGSTRG